MRTNYEFTLCEGYLLNKKNGKLEEYKPISITFDTEKEIVVYRGLFWDGERVVTESEFELYESVSAFERSEVVKPRKGYDLRTIFAPFCDVNLEDSKILAWTFANGKAEMINLKGYSVHFEIVDGCMPFYKAHLDEAVNLYSSKEDAININDVVVVDKDGNERVRQGLEGKLQLNGEQAKAIEDFTKAWKALTRLNVGVVVNTEDYSVFCCNKPDNIDETWYKEKGYTRVDDLLTHIEADIHSTFNCEGYWMSHIS